MNSRVTPNCLARIYGLRLNVVRYRKKKNNYAQRITPKKKKKTDERYALNLYVMYGRCFYERQSLISRTSHLHKEPDSFSFYAARCIIIFGHDVHSDLRCTAAARSMPAGLPSRSPGCGAGACLTQLKIRPCRAPWHFSTSPERDRVTLGDDRLPPKSHHTRVTFFNFLAFFFF